MSDSDVDLVEVGDATSLPPTPGTPSAAAAQPENPVPRPLTVETGRPTSSGSSGSGTGGREAEKSGPHALNPLPPAVVSPGGSLGKCALFAAFALPLALAIGAAAVSASSATALAGCQAELSGEREQLARLGAQLVALRSEVPRASAAEEQLKAANTRIAKLKEQCGWWCTE